MVGMGREGPLAMTDKTHKTEERAELKDPPSPRRPSYDKVAAEIEKWANSNGLRKPS